MKSRNQSQNRSGERKNHERVCQVNSCQWLQLADAYQAVEMKATAQACRSRGEYYGAMSAGQYIRTADGNVAEIVEQEEVTR